MVPEVEYPDLGHVLSGMGFDGCDLSVEPGGTVLPEQTPVDLVRAIEIFSGSGIEMPVITTAFLSIGEAWARNVIAIAARSGALFFRTGYSRRAGVSIADRRNEITGFAFYARAANIGLGLPYPGSEMLMRDLDPQWVGYDFDTALGTTQGSLAEALPRVRMVVLRDIRKEKDQTMPCPLGDGIVDWPALFTTLARGRFSGPLTLRVDYPAENRLDAIRHDLEFARKLLNAAYQKEIDSGSRRA
jgi:sugar phosphate isomerase/epimerase